MQDREFHSKLHQVTAMLAAAGLALKELCEEADARRRQVDSEKRQVPPLTDKQKNVVSALAARANEDGVVSMSLREIAQASGVPFNSVRDMIRLLVRDERLILVQEVMMRAPAIYQLALEHRMPKSAVVAILAPRPPRDVTARIMGDPAPGRTPWALTTQAAAR